jgi:cystathionine beta-synthase
MSEKDLSQIPVTRDKRIVGSLNENQLYNKIVANPDIKSQPVETIMQAAFPFVDISTPIDLISTMINPENPALLVRDFKTDKTFILTRHDIMNALTR